MDTGKHFLLIQSDYHTTRVGLFCDFFLPSIIDTAECDNKKISSLLFLTIDTLLQNNNLSLKNISFLAVNQGPGPFTTLRVIIASLNGLAYSTGLPVVGINGIKTLAHEHACIHNETYDYIIALMNAFCNDVYYGIVNSSNGQYSEGCVPFDALLEQVKSLGSASIKFVGLISEEQKNRLLEIAPSHILVQRSYFENKDAELSYHVASLEAMGKQAGKQWIEQENISHQLLPLYFKSAAPIMGTRKQRIL